MSVVGSFLWFYSMILEPVAHVRALGQIEIVFTLLISWHGFHERPTMREIAGVALVVGGVLTLVLAT